MNAKQVRESLNQRPLSYSSLKEFDRSPKHFIHYRTQPKKPKSSYDKGTAIDIRLLDGEDAFKKRVIKIPTNEEAKEMFDYDGKEFFLSNEGKKYKAELVAKAKKLKGVAITASDYKDVENMAEAVFANARASDLLQAKGECHKKLDWVDDKTGLPFVGELDKQREGLFTIDLKSAASAEPRAFDRDIFKLRYYLQAVYPMVTGMIDKPFFNIVIENTAPYGVCVRLYERDVVQYGLKEYRRLCDDFDRCLKNDQFDKSYDFYQLGDYVPVELPAYLKD